MTDNLSIVESHVLTYDNVDVRYIKASDGNIYIRTSDVHNPIGLTYAGLYLYMKKHEMPHDTKINVFYKQYHSGQYLETNFISSDNLLTLLNKRVTGRISETRERQCIAFRDWCLSSGLIKTTQQKKIDSKKAVSHETKITTPHIDMRVPTPDVSHETKKVKFDISLFGKSAIKFNIEW